MAIVLFYKNAIEKNTFYSFFQKKLLISHLTFSFSMLIETPIFHVDQKKVKIYIFKIV